MKRYTLLSHQWKAATRSAAATKNMGIKFFVGIVFFILFLEMIGGGFYLGTRLAENSEDPIAALTGYGLYFFLAILLARFMLQKLPTLMVRPYLVLPIQKSRLVNFLLTKPLFNALNILPLSLVLAISGGLHAQLDAYTFWLLMGIVISGDLFINYLSIFIKRVQIKHGSVFYIFLAVLAGLLLPDYFKLFSLQEISTSLFMQILQQPLWLLAILLLFGFAYYLNFQLLYRNFSLEDFARPDRHQRSSLENLTYLDRFGKIGTFALLELKMYIRNKRTRSMLFMTPLFMLYGLLFYTNPTYLDMNGFLIFAGIFITGGFIMSFGLYFFAWESGHFDLILTANNTYKDYVKAKYYLMLSASIIIFILTTFYVFFGIKILLINTACFLFNMGVNSLLLLYFGTNNNKYMDLSRGSAFNYQGVGGRHFVLMIPLLVIPIFIYLPFGILGQPNAGFALIGLIGLLGLLFRERMMDQITARFISKRYEMSEGFRNK